MTPPARPSASGRTRRCSRRSRRRSRAAPAGPSRFSAMQQGKAGTPVVYYAFDVLEIDGEPLIDLPFVERRKRLESLLDKRNRTVRLSETFDDGNALYEAATEQHLEGIMAKRLDSRYVQGKST